MRHIHLLAIVTATLLVTAAVAPAAAAEGATLDVDVSQDDVGAVTITVADNGTAVENATVNVSAIDGNYSDERSYDTGANGTVGLSAPTDNVTVEVTAETETATGNATVDLVVVNESTVEAEAFGARVSAFVHELFGEDVRVPWIGRTVAEFVVANNPGNAPDHAGPPDDNGPPANAGPPVSVQSADDDGTGNETVKANGNGNNGKSGGKPDHAGGPKNGNGKNK